MQEYFLLLSYPVYYKMPPNFTFIRHLLFIRKGQKIGDFGCRIVIIFILKEALLSFKTEYHGHNMIFRRLHILDIIFNHILF